MKPAHLWYTFGSGIGISHSSESKGRELIELSAVLLNISCDDIGRE
jgi:hypothetical protein